MLTQKILQHPKKKKYTKIRTTLIEEVNALSLNANRIEALSISYITSTKRLMSLEGKLMRLAESYGVDRSEFIKQYHDNELDPNWIRRVSRLSAKGWKDLPHLKKVEIKNIREEISSLASEAGLDVNEFRNIVHMVQRRTGVTFCKKRNGRGKLKTSYLDCKEIYKPRLTISRSYTGRKYRLDESCRKI